MTRLLNNRSHPSIWSVSFLILFVLAIMPRAKAEVLTNALSFPWSLALLPNGNFLITEKAGDLRVITSDGEMSQPVKGVPTVADIGQGGLLDVVLHPAFETNAWVYLSYSAGNRQLGYGTEVVRAKLIGNALTEHQLLFVAKPKVNGGRHFGGRLLFDREGYLYVGLGDRGDRNQAQNPSNHIGSVVRLHDDGNVPADNPFIGVPGHQPELYSYGHRNIQGLALHPKTGEIWAHEHGPRGGDELNRILPSKNYGWPVITYGVEYLSGRKIGEGAQKAGMEQPLHYWTPSIAPSGMAFYGDDILVGALKHQLLSRLSVTDGVISLEQHYFQREWGRIRDVRVAQEAGRAVIYMLTDSKPGRLIRITDLDKRR